MRRVPSIFQPTTLATLYNTAPSLRNTPLASTRLYASFPLLPAWKTRQLCGFPVPIPPPPSASPWQHPTPHQPIPPELACLPCAPTPAERRKCVGGLNKYPVVSVVAAGKVDNPPKFFPAVTLPVCALFQNPAVHFRTIGKHSANRLHPPPLSQLFNSPRQTPCGFPHRFVKTTSPPAWIPHFRNPRPPQQTPLPHLPQTLPPPAKNPPAIPRRTTNRRHTKARSQPRPGPQILHKNYFGCGGFCCGCSGASCPLKIMVDVDPNRL